MTPNARNRVRETRRLNARRNFLAHQIVAAAYCDSPDARATPAWMSSEILEWADLSRRLRAAKQNAK